ncbi:MAG: N-acetyl-gamma-glutamyl-phosphate reductase [Burkholderiaceae bacterium]|nr:N-acetyl-gamma-glutamyl-phosphate reductase [Burkholderiaceae bacterium]
MTLKVYVDGQHGTTGLQIVEELRHHPDVSLIELPAEQRRDRDARADRLNQADVAILCLPDDAAIEAVSMIGSDHTRVIDASTAHRIAPGWVFGFPELDAGQRDRLRGATRIANPGCYAVGAISLLRPVMDAAVFRPDVGVTIIGLSGYTGGGKDLIAVHETDPDPEPAAVYAMGMNHKHVPEIMAYGRLATRPLFLPTVGHYAQGMLVSIPFRDTDLAPGVPASAVLEALSERYRDEAFISVRPADDTGWLERERFLRPDRLNGSNRLEQAVYWNPKAGQGVMISRLDNLGKGASRSAVQLVNLIGGFPEDRA